MSVTMTRTMLAAACMLGIATAPYASVQPPAASPQPPAGRGGRGRGGVEVMTLTSTAFADGGRIPAMYTQASGEASPPLAWTNVPDGVTSFVLIVHDPDAAIGTGTDDILHWMVWNMPAASRSLTERVPHGPDLSDGAHQISATGPFYRGPGAVTSTHHYTFELYALDTTIDIPAVGMSPPQTRAAIVAAMAGHVRGKAVLVGLFKR